MRHPLVVRMLPSFLLCLWIAGTVRVSADAACPARVFSLKHAASLATLGAARRQEIVRALAEDTTEMAGQDVARESSTAAGYRLRFAARLEFQQPAPGLYLVRYRSSTMCGSYQNCPVWVLGSVKGRLRSLGGWRDGMGTSLTGAWGAAVTGQERYPELMLLTHESSRYTGVTCFRFDGAHYVAADCSPGCAHFLRGVESAE